MGWMNYCWWFSGIGLGSDGSAFNPLAEATWLASSEELCSLQNQSFSCGALSKFPFDWRGVCLCVNVCAGCMPQTLGGLAEQAWACPVNATKPVRNEGWWLHQEANRGYSPVILKNKHELAPTVTEAVKYDTATAYSKIRCHKIFAQRQVKQRVMLFNALRNGCIQLLLK